MSELTVRAVLFGDVPPEKAVAGTPGWRAVVEGLGGPLAALSPGGRAAVTGELSPALAGLFHGNVGEILIGGWRKHRGLVAAARATRADPSASEVVQLATHRISAEQRPHIEIMLNGATVARVGFELGLILDVDAVSATVRHGRLVALHGGRCTVTAALTAAGREILSRGATFDPAVTLSLGNGVALLPEHEGDQPDAPARGQAAVPPR